ncbi:cation diffusion facilitator family transporter [Knoellia locipacati]|uniref:cation diffusion facilitator family transporter n=1 Tax=Knoellia locipacati TaxID=882824 RepID=UPI00384B7EB2
MPDTSATMVGGNTFVSRLAGGEPTSGPGTGQPPRGGSRLPVFVGFLGNEAVAFFRIREGKPIGSAALVADEHHARTDGLSSLAVLVGAGGVAMGWAWADPVIGLVITAAILMVPRAAARDVFRRLMDGVEPKLVDDAEQALARVEGVRGVRRVRMRWIGHEIHADADLEVDPSVSLGQGHAIAHRAEDELVRALPKLAAAVVHAYPEHSEVAQLR